MVGNLWQTASELIVKPLKGVALSALRFGWCALSVGAAVLAPIAHE